MGHSWKYCEDLESCRWLIENQDQLFANKPYPYLYRREYIKEGFKANQLIVNFKMGKCPHENRIQYRHKAISTIATDLHEIFNHIKRLNNKNLCIVYPPVNLETDDDRFVLLSEQLKNITNYSIWIAFLKNATPLHVGGDRNPNIIKKNLIIKSKNIPPVNESLFFFIDDVITSGATFKAVSLLLKKKLNIPKLYGLFMSKTI